MKKAMIFPGLIMLLVLFSASMVIISGCGNATGGGGGGGSVPPKIYVADASNKCVIVLNPSSLESNISTIELPGAGNPVWMVLHPNGKKLYVADDYAHGSTSEVFVINTATDKVEDIIWVCGTARGMAFNSDGSKLFVNASNYQAICMITTATNTFTDVAGVDYISGTGVDIQGLAYNPNKNWLYACSMGSDRIDVATADATTTLTFTSIGVMNPYGVVYSPGTNSIYVACDDNNNRLVSYEASTLTMKASWDATNSHGYKNVAISPNGKYVYAATCDYSYIDSLDPSTGIKTGINLNSGAADATAAYKIAFSADSSMAFITDGDKTRIVAISTTQEVRVGQLDLPGTSLRGIVYKP